MSGGEFILVTADERVLLGEAARLLGLRGDRPGLSAQLFALADRPGIPARPQRKDPVAWASRRVMETLAGRVEPDGGGDCDRGEKDPWSISPAVWDSCAQDCEVAP